MVVRTPVAHARLAAGPSTLRASTDLQKATADCRQEASRQVLVRYPDKAGRAAANQWTGLQTAASQESVASEPGARRIRGEQRTGGGRCTVGVSDGEQEVVTLLLLQA